MEKESAEAGKEAADKELAKKARALLSKASKKLTGLQCNHTPPDSFQPGSAVEIAVDASGASVCCARLHYRHVNQAEEYVVTDMQKQDGGYAATIPADYTDSKYPLQYFLEFRDTRGRAWLYPRLNATLSNQPYYVIRQVR